MISPDVRKIVEAYTPYAKFGCSSWVDISVIAAEIEAAVTRRIVDEVLEIVRSRYLTGTPLHIPSYNDAIEGVADAIRAKYKEGQ